MKIADLKFDRGIFLAPMVDVTNLPFRLLCREFGAELAFTEMVYADAIFHENKKTKKMLLTNEKDKPLGVQVTSDKLVNLKKSIPYLKNFELVDLNCGCPSVRILGSKAGSYLLREPTKIAKFVRELKKNNFRVSVKVRLGFMENNILEIAQATEMAGADALTVHCRLSNEGYSKKANWDWLKKIKKVVKIPVIANGDIFSGKEVKKVLEISDGAMVGRAAMWNPRVFLDIINYLSGKDVLKIGKEQKMKDFSRYLNLCEEYLIELQKIKFVGSHFLKGFVGAAKLRDEFMKLKTFDEMKRFVSKN